MSSLSEKLIEFGLTEDESRIYSLVIQSGSMPLGALKILAGLKEDDFEEKINKLVNIGLLVLIDNRAVALPPIELISRFLYGLLSEYQHSIGKLTKILKDFKMAFESIRGLDTRRIVDIDTLLEEINAFKARLREATLSFTESSSRMEEKINELKSILSRLSNSFSSMENDFKKLRSSIEENLLKKDELKELVLTGLREQFGLVKSTIVKLVESLNTLQSEIQDVREKILLRLSNVFETISSFNKSLENFTSETIKIFLDSVSGSLGGAVSAILETLKEHRGRLVSSVYEREEELNRSIETIKKDVEEGYRSVIESFGKDMDSTLEKFHSDYSLIIEEYNRAAVEPLDKLSDLSSNVLERISKVFDENVKRLNAIPTALERAIGEATKAITAEFLKIYEENMEQLAELENETWVWLSKRILETADLLIETSDRLKALHGGLLDQISNRLDILREYILSLPSKIYSSVDMEWRNFLTDSTKRFEELFKVTKEELDVLSVKTIDGLVDLAKDFISTQKSGERILLESLHRIIENNTRNIQALMRNAVNSLVSIRDRLHENSDIEKIREELDMVVETLQKISKEDLEAEIERSKKYLDEVYDKREEFYEKIVVDYNEAVGDKVSKMIESVYDSLSKMEKGYIRDLDLLIESIKLIYSNQIDALNRLIDDSIQRIMDSLKLTQVKLDEILTSHSDTMVRIFRESTATIKERIDGFLNDFKAKLEELPKNYERGISELAVSARETLKGIAVNTVKVIKGIERELEENVSNVQKQMTSLKASVKEVNETYQKRLISLKENVKNLEDELLKGGLRLVNEYLETIMSDIELGLRSQISQLKEITSTLFENLDTVMEKAVKEGLSKAEHSLKEDLENITRKFLESLKELQTHAKKIEESYETISSTNIQEIMSEMLESFEDREKGFDSAIYELGEKITEALRGKFEEKVIKELKGKIDELTDDLSELNKLQRQLEDELENSKRSFKTLTDLLESSKISHVENILDSLNSRIKELVEENLSKLLEFLEKNIDKSRELEEVDVESLERIFTNMNRVYMTLVALRSELKRTTEKLMEKLSITSNETVIDEALKTAFEAMGREIKVYIGFMDTKLMSLLKKVISSGKIQLKVADTLAASVSNELKLRRVDRGDLYNVNFIVTDSKEVYIVKKMPQGRELVYIADPSLSQIFESAIF